MVPSLYTGRLATYRPHARCANAFEACVFTFGICQAGGAGKIMAEWIIEGQTEQDMWAQARAASPLFAIGIITKKGMESMAMNMPCISHT